MEFKCTNCGKTYSKWQGNCTACGEWNTIEQDDNQSPTQRLSKKKPKQIKLQSFKKLSGKTKSQKKLPTNIKALDKLLGGGMVEGQTILIAGEPGIGKSTAAVQIAAASQHQVSYISGEETAEQVAGRAQRLTKTNPKIMISHNSDTLAIHEHIIKTKPKIAIIDSVQTLAIDEINAAPGSIRQVKESSNLLVKAAKKTSTKLILIGQVTKSGHIAGPKTLEHLVDTVIYFQGDKASDIRIAKCTKNRFGNSNISAVFKMTKNGLKEIKDPATAFLSKDKNAKIGVAKTIAIDGDLPVGIEIQALTSPTSFSLPKRVARGIATNKLYLLAGVIEKFTNIKLGNQDIYLNIARGLSIKDPGIDLCICAAIISSRLSIPIPYNYFFFGEIELSGTIRKATSIKNRIQTATECKGKKLIGSGNRSTNIANIVSLIKKIKI